MSKPHRTELERFRYWQGQLLRSRDFRDQTETEAQLLHWHTRALHNVYGVAFGMETSLVAKTVELTAIRLTCGLAYDCYGRELLLPETREIRVPRIPTEEERKKVEDAHRPVTATLVASYKDAGKYPRKDESSAVCLTGQCKPLLEEPLFRWEFTTGCYETYEGVPLAKIRYVTNQLTKEVRIIVDPDFVQPRARPLARPRMASGHTIAGNTTWRLWEVDVLHPSLSNNKGGMEKVPVGMQTWIDTTSAGFTELPCYFAWLQGPLWEEEGGFLIAPLTSITDVSLNGFTFRLLMPPLYRRAYKIAIASASVKGVKDKHLHEVVVRVDDVSQFRIDDLVTVDGKTQATIQAIEPANNTLTLDQQLGTMKSGSVLRTANIKPEQKSIRLESVQGLQPGSEVIISSGGNSGLVVSGEVRAQAIIESINRDTSTITLAQHPARSVDIRLEAHVSPAVWQIFNESFTTRFLPFAQRKGLYVCWLGIECAAARPLDCSVRPGVQTLCP